MKLLLATVSLVLGIVIGMVLIFLLGRLFINLGLIGTLLSAFSAVIVTIPWLLRLASRPSSDKPSTGTMLIRGFALAVAFNAIPEFASDVLFESYTELMTWNDQVVIAEGRLTPAGWFLRVRGWTEGGVAGLIFCGSVAVVAKLIERLRRPSGA